MRLLDSGQLSSLGLDQLGMLSPNPPKEGVGLAS